MSSKIEKQPYCSPEIHRVQLDNEISLILVSGDPGDPGDLVRATFLPDFIKNDPFNTNLV